MSGIYELDGMVDRKEAILRGLKKLIWSPLLECGDKKNVLLSLPSSDLAFNGGYFSSADKAQTNDLGYSRMDAN